MEHERNTPLQLLCWVPWSSDAEAVLRNWNLGDMSPAWPIRGLLWAGLWRGYVPPLALAFHLQLQLGTATCSLGRDLNHLHCHTVPVMMDCDALRLEVKETLTSHIASARFSVAVTMDLLHSLVTSPDAGALGPATGTSPEHWPWQQRGNKKEQTKLTPFPGYTDVFPSFVKHVKFCPTCWGYFKPLLLLEGSIGLHMSQRATKNYCFCPLMTTNPIIM